MCVFVQQFFWLWLVLFVGDLAATVNPAASSSENTKLAPAASRLGELYREARDYKSNAASSSHHSYPAYDRPQTSRCISCLYAAMTGNQDRDR